jgi:hypothetical protein
MKNEHPSDQYAIVWLICQKQTDDETTIMNMKMSFNIAEKLSSNKDSYLDIWVN